MAKVLGVGGLFLKTRDADALRDWYARVLGVSFMDWGGAWFPATAFAAQPGAGTVLAPEGGDYDLRFNLVVDDLDGVLARCKTHGVEPAKLYPDEFNGRFAHILDPEGRTIELWEPKAIAAT
jgi:predicted enzyme related to lactoylglutathione lyase